MCHSYMLRSEENLQESDLSSTKGVPEIEFKWSAWGQVPLAVWSQQ